MTISTLVNKTILDGDGMTTAFPFSFDIPTSGDLEVIYTDSSGVETTLATSAYTVALTAIPAGQIWSPGGTVTYNPSGTPIASGTTLTIARIVALTQETSLINQGGYWPESVEAALDLLTMESQQIQEQLARTATLPISLANADGALPTPVAGLAIGWNATADGFANIAIAGSISVTSFGQSLINAATAAAARVIMGDVTAGLITASELTVGTGVLLGRTTAGTGAIETVTVGSELVLTAGTLNTYSTVGRLLKNVGFTVTMAANAVSIALKGADGNAPSSTNPVVIGFRSATITSGASSVVATTSAISTAISSGSTLGTTSAVPSRVWIGAILVSGAVELAVFQSLSGTSIAPINEGGLITTVAEGGAGGADTAQTWYSTTQRTNVPVTIIGYFDSTQGTAGTWATSASVIAVNPKYRPGDTVQNAYNATSAVATGTTLVPYDDTIPQITEGDQYMTQAITPVSSANVLEIEHYGEYSPSVAGTVAVSIFQDSVADALTTAWNYAEFDTVWDYEFNPMWRMVAATAISTTFKVRAGNNNAGTLTFCGKGGVRKYGGVAHARMSVKEISV